jgi:hypothetical protein
MVKQANYFNFGCHLGELRQKLGITFMLHIVLCKFSLMGVNKEEGHKNCHSCDKA